MSKIGASGTLAIWDYAGPAETFRVVAAPGGSPMFDQLRDVLLYEWETVGNIEVVHLYCVLLLCPMGLCQVVCFVCLVSFLRIPVCICAAGFYMPPPTHRRCLRRCRRCFIPRDSGSG